MALKAGKESALALRACGPAVRRRVFRRQSAKAGSLYIFPWTLIRRGNAPSTKDSHKAALCILHSYNRAI